MQPRLSKHPLSLSLSELLGQHPCCMPLWTLLMKHILLPQDPSQSDSTGQQDQLTNPPDLQWVLSSSQQQVPSSGCMLDAYLHCCLTPNTLVSVTAGPTMWHYLQQVPATQVQVGGAGGQCSLWRMRCVWSP